MVNVTKSNFLEQSNDLLAHLPSAAFVAIDEEMTGISLPNSQRPKKDHTPAQRYMFLKKVPETFQIIQLGICLFHQSPDWQPSDSNGPEFIARRYNFYMFPPADNNITRQVVMNPSSVAFLHEHGMDFNIWSREGIPFVTTENAEKLLDKFAKQQQESRDKKVEQAKQPTNFLTQRRVELRRTADIDFHARIMAALREWLDSSNPRANRHRHEGGHGPETDQPEGVSYLLPPCNAFLRRALYESISEEYPTLQLEKATGPGQNNQIRVLRLNPEEKQAREKRLLRESWEGLIVLKIGMWRVFQGLSLACQGKDIPFDSITFSRSVTDVDWKRESQVLDNLQTCRKKIPIVVHNGFMDLHFLLTHFHSHELPPTYPEAKALVRSYFPLVYDTKLLAVECMPPNQFGIESTHLENLFLKMVRDDTAMRHRILLSADHAIHAVGNDEQAHEAAYDAYMTGAVFVGICRFIKAAKQYGAKGYSATSNGFSGVGSLTHLVAAEDDKEVKRLFGRNMLYLMMSLFTLDLEQPLSDPLSLGRSANSTYRVSGFDASVTTRTIVNCLASLTDTSGNSVSFEITWIDDTAFLVAANKRTAGGITIGGEEEEWQEVLNEHGELILKALKERFSNKETIMSFEHFLGEQERATDSATSAGDGTWTARVAAFVQRTLFAVGDVDTENRKRTIADVEQVEASRKKRRIV